MWFGRPSPAHPSAKARAPQRKGALQLAVGTPSLATVFGKPVVQGDQTFIFGDSAVRVVAYPSPEDSPAPVQRPQPSAQPLPQPQRWRRKAKTPITSGRQLGHYMSDEALPSPPLGRVVRARPPPATRSTHERTIRLEPSSSSAASRAEDAVLLRDNDTKRRTLLRQYHQDTQRRAAQEENQAEEREALQEQQSDNHQTVWFPNAHTFDEPSPPPLDAKRRSYQHDIAIESQIARDAKTEYDKRRSLRGGEVRRGSNGVANILEEPTAPTTAFVPPPALWTPADFNHHSPRETDVKRRSMLREVQEAQRRTAEEAKAEYERRRAAQVEGERYRQSAHEAELAKRLLAARAEAERLHAEALRADEERRRARLAATATTTTTTTELPPRPSSPRQTAGSPRNNSAAPQFFGQPPPPLSRSAGFTAVPSPPPPPPPPQRAQSPPAPYVPSRTSSSPPPQSVASQPPPQPPVPLAPSSRPTLSPPKDNKPVVLNRSSPPRETSSIPVPLSSMPTPQPPPPFSSQQQHLPQPTPLQVRQAPPAHRVILVTPTARQASPPPPSPLSPSRDESQLLRARELFESGDLEAALHACQEAARSLTALPAASVLAARVALARGDLALASRWLGRAAGDPGAKEVVAAVSKAIQVRDRCLATLGRNGALALATQAVELSPQCASLRVLRFAAALPASTDNADLEEAVRLCASARLSSDVARPALQHARILHRAGQVSTAATLLRSVRAFVPGDSAACALLDKELAAMESAGSTMAEARAALASGKFADAVRLLSTALQAEELHAVRAQLLCDRASAHLEMGAWASAAEDCDEALRLHPTLSAARVRRARALIKLGRVRDAVSDLEVANRGEPSAATRAELDEARRILREHQDRRRQFERTGFGPPPTSAGAGRQQAPPPPPSSRYSAASARAPPRVDFYAVLGVARDATPGEIRKAFHKQALAHHPDKNPNDEQAAARFKSVLDAFQVLQSPELRRKHDIGLI